MRYLCVFLWLFCPALVQAAPFAMITHKGKTTVWVEQGNGVSLRIFKIRRPLVFVRSQPAELRKIEVKGRWLRQIDRLRWARVGKKSRMFTLVGRRRLSKRRQVLRLSRYGYGLFLLEGQRGAYMAYGLALRTKLGVIVKRSRRKVWVYAARLRDGRPVARGRVAVVGRRRLLAQGTTNGKGLWSRSLAYRPKLLVAFRKGAQVALSAPEFYPAEHAPLRALIYTDRPLYLPRQKVHFKIIVRARKPRNARGYRHSSSWAGQAVGYKVYRQGSPREGVAQGRVQLNRWGAASGSFRLQKGAHSGLYVLMAQLKGRRFQAEFRVEFFRKPPFQVRVKVAQRVVLRGASTSVYIHAHYYAGTAVSGARYRWFLYRKKSRQRWQLSRKDWLLGSEGRLHAPKLLQTGRGVLNGLGRARLVLRVPAQGPDGVYSWRVEVTGRQRAVVAGSAQARVVRSRYRLSLRLARLIALPGEATQLWATVAGHDGKPAKGIALQAKLAGQQRKGRSDARGQVGFRFAPKATGLQKIEVKGPGVSAHTYLWVSRGGDSTTRTHRLRIFADKRRYKAGQRARFLIHAPQAKGWLWLSLEGRRIRRSKVVEVRGHSVLWEFPITADDAPNAYVTAVGFSRGRFTRASHGFEVPLRHQGLKISIAPDKEHYKPREVGRFRIQVRDHKGRPQPGVELSVALVDRALYALEKEQTPEPLSFFYPRLRRGVRSYASLHASFVGEAFFSTRMDRILKRIRSRQRRLRWGPRLRPRKRRKRLIRILPGRLVIQNSTVHGWNTSPSRYKPARAYTGKPVVYGSSAKRGLTRSLRRSFTTSLLWRPHLRTDAKGQAVLQVRYPDNLTRWRLTALGVSQTSQVGRATGESKTRLPFFVSLATPSLLTHGDELRLAGMLHNTTRRSAQVKLKLRAWGLHVRLLAPEKVEVRAGEMIRVELQVRARKGARQGRLRLEATGPLGNDALERSFPILPFGVEMGLSHAALLRKKAQVTRVFAVPRSHRPRELRLEIQADGGLRHAIPKAVRPLIQYPYGCLEQTTGRFLPLLSAVQLLKASPAIAQLLPARLLRKAPSYTRAGIRRLLALQRHDGGWGWWGRRRVHPRGQVSRSLALQVASYQYRRCRQRHGVRRCRYLYQHLPSTVTGPVLRYLNRSHPWMTAYVMQGLLEAKRAGFRVSGRALSRGRGVLRSFLDEKNYAPEVRAYVCWVLLQLGADPRAAKKARDLLALAKFGKMGLYGLSWLLRIYRRHRARARFLAQKLRKSARNDGQGTHWRGKSSFRPTRWQDDPQELTATVAHALFEHRPKDPRISRSIRWLLLQRRRGHWRSTRVDAAAVLFLAAVLAKEQLKPRAKARLALRLNGVSIGTLEVPLVSRHRRPFVYRGAALKVGQNRLQIRMLQGGGVFVEAGLRYFRQAGIQRASTGGLRLKRHFFRLRLIRANGGLRYQLLPLLGKLRSGELVLSRLYLTTTRRRRFAMISHPIPAGFELLSNRQPYPIPNAPTRLWTLPRSHKGDHIAAFFSRLQPGKTQTLDTLFRVLQPGTVRALPAAASLVYFPAIRGLSSTRVFRILP